MRISNSALAEITLEKDENALKKELEQPRPKKDPLMKQTFIKRRDVILESPEGSVVNLISQYKGLKFVYCVSFYLTF